MLMGALADMYDIPPSDEYTLHKETLRRNCIDCISAKAYDTAHNDITRKAVSEAIRNLGIDYVMCSAVPLGDDADGDVIAVLQNGGVEMYPSDRSAYILPEEAQFLVSVISECADKPPMDIVAVGYGADTEDEDAFLCATVGEYGENNLLEKQYEYGEYV